MVERAENTEVTGEEIKRLAAQRAGERAKDARWDLNIAIFLFLVLIIVIILLSQQVGIEVVAPVAVFGLSMVWLMGWRQGRRLYTGYYQEELAKLERESPRKKKLIEAEIDETIEEKVQKALRERWR